MQPPTFSITTQIRIMTGHATWHVVIIETDLVRQIQRFNTGLRHGFGSIPVRASIGASQWQTSIFPHQQGAYFLPVKQSVRVAESISQGETIQLELQLTEY